MPVVNVVSLLYGLYCGGVTASISASAFIYHSVHTLITRALIAWVLRRVIPDIR